MNDMWRRPPVIVGIVAVVAVVVLAVVLTRGSSESGSTTAVGSSGTTASSSSPSTSSTTDSSASSAASVTTTTQDPTAVAPPPTAPVTTLRPTGPYTTPDMPLEVTVLSSTTGLKSGDVVRVKVVPKGDSSIFGVEARLCSGTAYVDQDPEFRPTQGANCVGRPVAEGTDALVTVPVAPPYKEADVQFRVGVGSDTFPTQDGGRATVTCGPANPCQVVLKLQYPKAFGFQAIPVTFA